MVRFKKSLYYSGYNKIVGICDEKSLSNSFKNKSTLLNFVFMFWLRLLGKTHLCSILTLCFIFCLDRDADKA